MAVQGVANLQAQWAIIGEFSNLPQEELLDWILENTEPSESHDNPDPKSLQNPLNRPTCPLSRPRSHVIGAGNHVCNNFRERFPLKVRKISVISADI